MGDGGGLKVMSQLDVKYRIAAHWLVLYLIGRCSGLLVDVVAHWVM